MRTVRVNGEDGRMIGSVQIELTESKRFVKLRVAAELGYLQLALDRDELNQVMIALAETSGEAVE